MESRNKICQEETVSQKRTIPQLMVFTYQKATSLHSLRAECESTSSGSESTACTESRMVNMGDPHRPQKDRVSEDKPQSQGIRKVYVEVRCVIVPKKRSKDRGGKDAG